MKKLYPKGWLAYHPYTRTDEVDYYYTGIANRIKRFLFTGPLQQEEDWCDCTAYALAAWFEDVISQTGIWETFTEECERTYGARLPFYPIGEDYYPDEVNLEDIRFLLWHFRQQECVDEGRIVNPENPGLEMLALRIYELLYKEYETAPENKRMQAYFRPKSGEVDYAEFRDRVEWFHYFCYVNPRNLSQHKGMCEKLLEGVADDMDDEDEETEFQRYNLLCYSLRLNSTLTDQGSLAGLTTPDYLTRVWKRNSPAGGPWENVEVRPLNYYRCLRDKGDTFVVEPMDGSKKEMLLAKISLADCSNILPGKSILLGQLAQYGSLWYHNGMMSVSNELTSDLRTDIQRANATYSNAAERQVFKSFITASKGRLFLFPVDKEELRGFIQKKMKYSVPETMDLPDTQNHGLMLTASPATGLHIQNKLAECVCSPDNLFYSKAKADQKAHEFIFNPKSIPYELSCALQELNLLPDARINSMQGEEHGRRFLHANARFLTDYFFHRNRTKDFDNSELRKWIK